MINSKRLSKIIQTTISKRVRSNLLEVYDSLSSSQRKEIRDMFNKNKNI